MDVLSAAELQAFERDGFIVVPSAISAEQAAATADEVWQFAGANPSEPDATSTIMVEMYHGQRQWQNRSAERVHGAFSQLWKTERLRVSHDRVSIAPPVPDALALAQGASTGPSPVAGWPVGLDQDGLPEHGLHFDVGALRGTAAEARAARPLPFGLQGVIYLVDTPPEQGAFVAVPGFHRRIDAWLETLPPELDDREGFSIDKDFRKSLLELGTTRVGGKAGDMVSPDSSPARPLLLALTVNPTAVGLGWVCFAGHLAQPASALCGPQPRHCPARRTIRNHEPGAGAHSGGSCRAPEVVRVRSCVTQSLCVPTFQPRVVAGRDGQTKEGATVELSPLGKKLVGTEPWGPAGRL